MNEAVKRSAIQLDKAMNDSGAASTALRQILIAEPKTSAEIIGFGSDYLDEEDQKQLSVTDIAELVEAVHIVSSYEFGGRDMITDLAIRLSLCPKHLIDWAICFDDQAAECSQIREIFPNSHDT